MGREIRMVPPNWEHPMKDPPPIHWIPGVGLRHDPSFQPMYDKTFDDAAKDWRDEFAKWERGERESYFNASEYPNGIEFWEWHGEPPDRKYYRPWKDEDATWVQLWETVSEGTPVSPPFATREELAQYLAVNGDYWDQKRGDGGWGIESARAFVEVGWAPSMMVRDGVITDSKDIPLSYQKQDAK